MACHLSPRCHTPQNSGQGAVLSPGHQAGLRTNLHPLATINNHGGFTPGAAVGGLQSLCSGVTKPSRSGMGQGHRLLGKVDSRCPEPSDTQVPWCPFLLSPTGPLLHTCACMLSQAVSRAVVPTAYVSASVWKKAPHRKEAVFGVPQFPYLKQKPMATCDHHDVPPEAP